MGLRILAVCRGFRSMSFIIRLLDTAFIDITGFVLVFIFMIITFILAGNYLNLLLKLYINIK